MVSREGRLVFSGRVLPERERVSLYGPFPFRAVDPDGGPGWEAKIGIRDSQILVSVDVEHRAIPTSTLKNGVEHVVQSALNAAGFCWGSYHDIEIDSVVDEGGEMKVFDPSETPLALLDEDPVLEVPELVELALNERGLQLRRALNDLRMALRHPIDTGFYCYRAIEALMRHFLTELGLDWEDRDQAWKALREELQIEKELLMTVKEDLADSFRHGGIEGLDGIERSLAILACWKTVNRFVAYLDSDDDGLDESEWSDLKEDEVRRIALDIWQLD